MSDISNYKISNDLDLAASEANKEVNQSGGARSFPVSIFRQGTRDIISTVFPVIYIVNDLKSNPTEKGSGVYDARTSMNRPLDLNHAKTTKDYIKRN